MYDTVGGVNRGDERVKDGIRCYERVWGKARGYVDRGMRCKKRV